jgi:hypothetical protein
MLKLAYEHDRLARMPVLHKLDESALRQGFFEAGAFAGVRRRWSLTWLLTEQVARAKTLERELKLKRSPRCSRTCQGALQAAHGGISGEHGRRPAKNRGMPECCAAISGGRPSETWRRPLFRARGDETDRPPDGERLPPVRDRVAGRP